MTAETFRDPLATLTIEDVAGLLQLAPKTVRAMCKRGELRSLTVARRVRIPRAAVAALLGEVTPSALASPVPQVASEAPPVPWPNALPRTGHCPMPVQLPRPARPARPRTRASDVRTST